ncbi:MAG: uroporphyrinogen-III synthase [Acidimicrobiales bacterium]
MEPLAGWTVAVTAGRRAAEQIELLERRGAHTVHVPTILTASLGPEAGLRDATAELLEQPPDVLVATTAIGMRGWFASSWAWGQGDALHDALADRTEIYARGPKAAAAVIGEGLPVHWRAPGATSTEILQRLGHRDLQGRRIAVQLAGRRDATFTTTLRNAGAQVIELPVYEWTIPPPTAATRRLVELIIRGEVDAVTFTCAYAVTNLLELAGPDADAVISRFRRDLVAACVGPVTAAAARRAGVTTLVTARPARLGAMVRALTDHLAGRGRRISLCGRPVLVQGAHLDVDGVDIRLTPRERVLFDSLLDAGGSVLSKARLAHSAWDAPVDDHAVEVAVNRLRRKLGTVADAIETTNRRGYRLALTGPLGAMRGTVHRDDLPA